ncbi:aminotransferase class III-fold pyridoxal phosphate-dependent enzyme [Telluria beijingensis]|uniref:aminotransferase class III-fold pyridoxal phosphate-dependent enzyme n=1 Tax=Telluria beijingensis TaxID=3068633 RepID=UPI002795E3FF|nr:aminotransferase class III-fold pyridoxal phosphate-dependent enzyme [Massilia sp. REN29]
MAINFGSLSIVAARDDLLYTSDGRELIDLFNAHGTTWLGHRRREVHDALARQMDQVWITGGLPTPAVPAMRERVARFLPSGLTLASLASTGMEANEQALRVARVHTGRNGALGLAGAMHGKSLATATLGWDNGDGLALPGFQRIAAGPDVDEAVTLAAISAALRGGQVAALYIEPVHGTSFGWEASPAFYHAVRELATLHGVLLVYDEILTGCHRTGTAFRCQAHGVEPDILVFGKALGNGFPVAATAVRASLPLVPHMLLGSTYSNNALAASAVDATLECIEGLDAAALVAAIEAAVLRHLGWAASGDRPRLRGCGAMWVVRFDTPEQALACATSLLAAGVCVGLHGRQMRLLPALTIAPHRLEQACAQVALSVRANLGG